MTDGHGRPFGNQSWSCLMPPAMRCESVIENKASRSSSHRRALAVPFHLFLKRGRESGLALYCWGRGVASRGR